jgi:hypothetical protein
VDEPFSFTPAPGDNVWILGPVYGGLLQVIETNAAIGTSPVYYYDRTSSGGTEGPGGTTYYIQDGSDP